MQYKVAIVEMPEKVKDVQDVINNAIPSGWLLASVASDLGAFGHRLIIVMAKPAAA